MKAVRVHKFGPPDVLTVEDNVPIPTITDDQVLERAVSLKGE
jgi:NADPH:quinone reductase-like Zn-dependent oxidoreductase